MKEAEEIPLIFKLMSILALLSNYDQENCLINLGTEGFFVFTFPGFRTTASIRSLQS